MTGLHFDHIVVSAERLEDGVAYVEDVLGVTLAPGGKHPGMGTHNQLMHLGEIYLEVIATDPEAAPPAQPRWFDLDDFKGAPRLTNWMTHCTNLPKAVDLAPEHGVEIKRMTRGDLAWDVAVSADGRLPFEGGFPGMIDWGETAHPTTRLPDIGCRLARWEVSHPEGAALSAALAAMGGGLEQHVIPGPKGFRAAIETPHGLRVLT